MAIQEQPNGLCISSGNGSFSFAAGYSGKNPHLFYPSNNNGMSGPRHYDTAYRGCTLFTNVALDQGAAIKKVMTHGPSRRSSMMASETVTLPFVSASISACNAASSMSFNSVSGS